MLIFITFFLPFPSVFVPSDTEEIRWNENHEKTVTKITCTPKDRLPEIFKMCARAILYLFFRSLVPSTIGLLETEGNLTEIKIKNIHETSMAFSTVPTQKYSQFALT